RVYDLDPGTLDDVNTNWAASVIQDSTTLYRPSAFDYELQWVNPADSLYRTPRFILQPYNFLFLYETPVYAVNVTTGEVTDFLIDDIDDDGELSAEDVLYIVDERAEGGFAFRYIVDFDTGGAASVPPEPGTRLRVSVTRPFATGDTFEFSLRPGGTDNALAQDELDRIAVVPNPYVGASIFERRSQVEGRGERRIQFINLPPQCTIRIFNLRGELVKTIQHDGLASDGSEFWDLRTEGGQDVAYGIYVYHVEAPGIGEMVGKLALVK
ncbi:MAG: hypothetical protein AAFN13_05045, partial [Bacteroidota bacterium]